MQEKVTSKTLGFIKKNVLNISEVTRTNKLAEILNSFADTKSEEIYVVQNSRKKDAQGVFVDIEYFQELLVYKEVIEEAKDMIVLQMATERQRDVAEIPLATVIEKNGLDIQEILSLVDKAEIE